MSDIRSTTPLQFSSKNTSKIGSSTTTTNISGFGQKHPPHVGSISSDRKFTKLQSQNSESLSANAESVKSSSDHHHPPRRHFIAPSETSEAEENRRVSFIVGLATAIIFLSAFLLIAITLKLTPKIDEIYQGQSENVSVLFLSELPALEDLEEGPRTPLSPPPSAPEGFTDKAEELDESAKPCSSETESVQEQSSKGPNSDQNQSNNNTDSVLVIDICPIRNRDPCDVDDVKYIDCSTWTAEDDIPRLPGEDLDDSDLDLDNPIVISAPKEFRREREPPSSNRSSSKSKSSITSGGGKKKNKDKDRGQGSRQGKKSRYSDQEECFTVASALCSRESRLYENVPSSSSTANALVMAGLGVGQLETMMLLGNNPGGSGGSSGASKSEFLSVNDFLPQPQASSSRSSWGDSGRESLSFDGDSSSNNSKNLLLIPPPPPPHGGSTTSSNNSQQQSQTSHQIQYQQQQLHHQHPQYHNPHHAQYHNNYFKNYNNSPSRRKNQPISSGIGSQNSQNQSISSNRRLVRQKHAIEDDFGDNGSFLAVPSPIHNSNRNRLVSTITSSTNHNISSPINLQRHPNMAQSNLAQNKKSQSLIPCDSPYGIASGSHALGRYSRNVRSPTRNILGRQARQNQSFDYGELPSHQMFPKRHLLGCRQFNNPTPPPILPSSNNYTQHQHQQMYKEQPQLHRSFPAPGIFGSSPRSCSMGDLFSSSHGSLSSIRAPSGGDQAHLSPSIIQTPVPSSTQNQNNANNTITNGGGDTTSCISAISSTTVPLITTLPPNSNSSVTYEFSLAPMDGTMAPGWHLTTVQRGLASTALVPAAVVARRRLPRPRSGRQRLGFTDKTEARRAKCTIAITFLALLAMSMLLVGITLRLAPLIDELVRRENESMMNKINIIGKTTPSPTIFLNNGTNVTDSSTDNNTGAFKLNTNTTTTQLSTNSTTIESIGGIIENESAAAIFHNNNGEGQQGGEGSDEELYPSSSEYQEVIIEEENDEKVKKKKVTTDR